MDSKPSTSRLLLLLTLSITFIPAAVFAASGEESSSWRSLLRQVVRNRWTSGGGDHQDAVEKAMMKEITLKNYCESWRLNVELHNVRGFGAVPAECTSFVAKYMSSSQYKSDVQRATDEAALFLTSSFSLAGDGRDIWVFDVDDTLLSTLPFYKSHQFGGSAANRTLLEEWMAKEKAPAVEGMLDLYHDIRRRGLTIFLLSSRPEHLRDATDGNLIKAGFHGWARLILRCDEDGSGRSVQKYMSEERKKMVNEGYRLWGMAGAQWSSLLGHPKAKRTFKVPNPMYYIE
ncbi:Acid phosphatase 1 [Apostasia shenzhenica]|uniref:Acid phosphatase 1 n=1 Tax=Apostasia shenzhenica TaxID=1088818 RepID=A0A2I0AV45_9ASPA|nr:Acid phosphatase 1 [Apostasia shenzhenica]